MAGRALRGMYGEVGGGGNGANFAMHAPFALGVRLAMGVGTVVAT